MYATCVLADAKDTHPVRRWVRSKHFSAQLQPLRKLNRNLTTVLMTHGLRRNEKCFLADRRGHNLIQYAIWVDNVE